MKSLRMYNQFMLYHLLIASHLLMFAGNTFGQSADLNISAQKSACEKNSAMTWSSSLNRCVGKAEARQARNESKDCQSLTDPKSRENCHIALAGKNTGVETDPEKAVAKISGNQTQSAVINGANSIVSAINYFAKDKATDTCMSKQIFGITALGGFATDIYLKTQTTKKVKSLEDKFKVESTDTAYNAQLKALEFLRDEQKVVRDIASQEKKRQMILMLGYGAAAATAAYEGFFNKECWQPETKTADTTNTVKETPKAEVTQNKELTTSSDSFSMKDDLPVMAGKLKKLMGTPPGIMVLAGIGGANSAILYSGASSQETESADNIKKIEKIMATYKDSWTNFCPNGYDKLEDPNCYCYTPEGKQNPARSNSQTCTSLWAKNKYFYDSTAGVYASKGIVDPAGCLNVNGQFDEGCRCKKMLDSKGNNACMKSIGLNIEGNALGASYIKSSGFDNVMKSLNSTISGNANLSGLNEKLLSQAISRQKQINQGLLNNIKKDPKKKDYPDLNASTIEKATKAVFTKSDLDAIANSSGGNPIGVAFSSGLPKDQAKLLASVQKTNGLDLATSGKGFNNNAIKKKSLLDFGDIGSGTNSNGSVLDGFSEESPKEAGYKYKNSDIVTNSDATIFEIISNRYILSGLPRLFEE